MSAPPPVDAERLAREREHDRLISDRAEKIWDWDSPAGRRRADRRGRFFVDHGGLAPGVRALEVGCGTGVFLERTAPCGARIAGIDLSTELLARARQRVAGTANVRLLCGNVEQMPWPDGAFDVVYGSSILHHLRLGPALAEIRRVLRPGGRIVFTEPNLWNPQIAFMYLVGPRARFGLSPDEMAFTRRHAGRMLAAAGFTEASVVHFDFLHPSIPAPLLGPAEPVAVGIEKVPLLRRISGSLLVRARRP